LRNGQKRTGEEKQTALHGKKRKTAGKKTEILQENEDHDAREEEMVIHNAGKGIRNSPARSGCVDYMRGKGGGRFTHKKKTFII